MTVAASILPIVSVILVGFLCVRTGLVAREKWEGVETLGFNVLIPSIIINSIYKSDLSATQIGAYVWVLFLVIGIVGLFSLSLTLSSLEIPRSKLSTLFQAATRWNAFIALAVGEQILGQPALSMIAIAMAFIIPAINIANIIVLTIFGGPKPTIAAVAIGVAKNPLVIACAIGLSLNLSGIVLPTQILAPLDLISRAALAVGLLAVGANLDLKRLFSPSVILIMGVALRNFAAPTAFLMIGGWAGLNPIQLACGALICGVPAASNGYIVAKKMGGDAELYADILTWQTVVAPLSITMVLYAAL